MCASVPRRSLASRAVPVSVIAAVVVHGSHLLVIFPARAHVLLCQLEQILGALFIARLYGIDVPPEGLVAICATALVTSFSVPGIPGGSIIAMVPVLMVVNLPVEGIGILLGVDTILDMFRTVTNTTGHLSAAVVLARGEHEIEGTQPPGAP